MQTELDIYQVDAFTQTPLAGNPAAVVPEADGLGEDQMRRIAREMNLSETAFLLPPTTDEADLRIRWFTPAIEVSLCGHATVASLHVLAERGDAKISDRGASPLRLETASGILPATVETGISGSGLVTLGVPLAEFEPFEVDEGTIARLVGTEPDRIRKDLPILISDLGYALVAVDGMETLGKLSPDFAGMVDLEARLNRGLLAFGVFTTETAEPDSLLRLRFFAPGAGIDEDPVTGSAHGALGAYVFNHGLADASRGRVTYKAEQGDEIGRPGRVWVTIRTRGDLLDAVSIAGRAVTVLRGRLLI